MLFIFCFDFDVFVSLLSFCFVWRRFLSSSTSDLDGKEMSDNARQSIFLLKSYTVFSVNSDQCSVEEVFSAN